MTPEPELRSRYARAAVKPPAVYLITGPMAAGKSTVAQLLALRFERGVCLEGDLFRRSIASGREDMTPDASPEALEQLRLRYRLTATAADRYFDAGFNVVVEDVAAGPILSDYAEMIHSRPCHVVILLPSLKAIAAREAGRDHPGYGTWTIEQLYDGFVSDTPRVGLWLDTTNLTPEETVEEIVARTVADDRAQGHQASAPLMPVEVRTASPGDGAALARVWLDNARYYVSLFPDDFRIPDEAGLGEWFEAQLAKPGSAEELHLVAAVNGTVGAFAYARLAEPDEHASRQMLGDYPFRRVHVEALGTADAFQRRGLATMLVEAVEAWARERGARAISAETYLESPVSIPFWEQRMGYRRRSVKFTKRLS